MENTPRDDICEYVKPAKQAQMKDFHLFSFWADPGSVEAGLLGNLFTLLITICNLADILYKLLLCYNPYLGLWHVIYGVPMS